MKKISFYFILLFLLGCSDYQPNNQINSRRPPIIIIAIDTTINSVLMRDGDNHVFTIYDNATTKAISSSLKVKDTIRLPFIIKKKF